MTHIHSNAQEHADYVGSTITNVRQGKGDRWLFTYGTLRAADGCLLINATFDYIKQILTEQLTKEEYQAVLKRSGVK